MSAEAWNEAAASIPEEWVTAAKGHYSMHGAGLIRNILAGVAPLIRAAERERIRQMAIKHEATYRPDDLDLPSITGVPGLTKPGPDPLGDPFADLIGDADHA